MSTGIIKIKSNEKLIMKIITKTGGNNANLVAKELKAWWPFDSKKAYEIALAYGFGSFESLVVLTDDTIEFQGQKNSIKGIQEVFEMNPYYLFWEYEIADYVEEVEV